MARLDLFVGEGVAGREDGEHLSQVSLLQTRRSHELLDGRSQLQKSNPLVPIVEDRGHDLHGSEELEQNIVTEGEGETWDLSLLSLHFDLGGSGWFLGWWRRGWCRD